jgi:hypothetical protein
MVCMLALGGLSIVDDLAEDSGRRLTLPPADAVLNKSALLKSETRRPERNQPATVNVHSKLAGVPAT